MGLEKNLGDVGWTGILFLWCTHRYGLPLACALAQGFLMCNSPCTSLPSVPVCFSCSVSTACGERSRPLSFCSLAARVLCFNFRFPAPYPCWVFGLLGVFLSKCVFHPVADRCVRRRLLATSTRLARLQRMTGAAEEKNSHAKRPFGVRNFFLLLPR